MPLYDLYPLKTLSLRTKLLGATVLVGALGSFVSESFAVTDDSQAQAVIFSAASPAVSPIDELNFGEIITTGGAGTVTISTAGAPTLLGVSHTGGSPHHQAIMRVVGTPAAQVDINIVPGAYSVSNGVVTMAVTAFDIGNGANAAHTITLGGGGTFDINIGATLNVGAGQQVGNYTGTFTLNADYH